MSLYAVKNDKGEWWDFEAYDGFWGYGSCECAVTAYKERADSVIKEHGGHVVELVEKPEPVEVSEEDGARLEKIRKATCPWDTVSFYAGRNKEYANFLMRAYVNGWKVVKPKRWNVKVPHMREQYYYVDDEGELRAADRDTNDESNQQFTLAEIEHYGLGECERVEVCADNARTTGEVTDDEQ